MVVSAREGVVVCWWCVGGVVTSENNNDNNNNKRQQQKKKKLWKGTITKEKIFATRDRAKARGFEGGGRSKSVREMFGLPID